MGSRDELWTSKQIREFVIKDFHRFQDEYDPEIWKPIIRGFVAAEKIHLKPEMALWAATAGFFAGIGAYLSNPEMLILTGAMALGGRKLVELQEEKGRILLKEQFEKEVQTSFEHK